MAIARRQHSVIGQSQLTAIGFTASAIRSRVARGRLHRVHHGVYCLFPPPFTVRQWWIAAVLACGPESALCGPSAAALQDIADLPGLPAHVRSPARIGRRRPGIAVHRGAIDPRDLRIVDGIRTVSADLVLVDLAPDLVEAELEVVLVAAESKRLLKRGRLGELVAERRGRPGIPKLERLLALEPAIVRSDRELLMLPIARMAGLERPLVNHPIAVPGRDRPLIVDFAWRDLRMAVEADSPALPRRLGARARRPRARSTARPGGLALPPVHPRPLRGRGLDGGAAQRARRGQRFRLTVQLEAPGPGPMRTC